MKLLVPVVSLVTAFLFTAASVVQAGEAVSLYPATSTDSFSSLVLSPHALPPGGTTWDPYSAASARLRPQSALNLSRYARDERDDPRTTPEQRPPLLSAVFNKNGLEHARASSGIRIPGESGISVTPTSPHHHRPFSSMTSRRTLPPRYTTQTPPTFRDEQDPSTSRTTPPSVFAFGDIHGDYTRFRGLLHASGLAYLPASLESLDLQSQIRWLGGESVAVFVGDIVDKGKQPFSVYAAIAILKRLAEKESGKIELLFGNHDLMRMNGDVSQVGLTNIDFRYEQVVDRSVWTVFARDKICGEQNRAERCAARYAAAVSHPTYGATVRIVAPSSEPASLCFPESLANWLQENAL